MTAMLPTEFELAKLTQHAMRLASTPRPDCVALTDALMRISALGPAALFVACAGWAAALHWVARDGAELPPGGFWGLNNTDQQGKRITMDGSADPDERTGVAIMRFATAMANQQADTAMALFLVECKRPGGQFDFATQLLLTAGQAIIAKASRG